MPEGPGAWSTPAQLPPTQQPWGSHAGQHPGPYAAGQSPSPYAAPRPALAPWQPPAQRGWAPPHSWPPPGPRATAARTREDAERPGRHRASGVVVALLITSMLAFSLVFGRLPADAYGTAAEAMLPADAHRARFTAGGTGLTSGEWARGRFGMLHAGPDPFGWWLNTAKMDVREATYARWTTGRPGEGPAGGSDTLFTVGPDGLRLQVTYSNGSALIYSGGRLELPAGLAAGSTWQSEGATLAWTAATGVGAPQPYTSTGRATAAADPAEQARGCLDVVVTQTPGDLTSARTWCPGQGIVRFAADGRTWAADPAAPTPATSAVVRPFRWDKAEAMQVSTLATQTPSSLLSLTLIAPSGILPDGRLVTFNAYNGAVVAVDPASTLTDDRTVWRARPGGLVMTGATIGEVSVAVTSQRELVAYGPDGTWLWTRPLTDTTRQPPVELGGSIVVVTDDGVVTGVDPASGAVRWRHGLPTEIQSAPVRVGDGLLVHDEGGTIAHLGPAGELRWQRSGPLVELLAVAGGTVVATERGANSMRGYSLADGEPLWKRSLHQNLTSLVGAGGVAVAQATGEVVAFDGATGGDAWTMPGEAYALVAGPDRVLVTTAQELVLLDGSGHQLRRWRHGLEQVPDRQVAVSLSGERFVVQTWWHMALGTLA